MLENLKTEIRTLLSEGNQAQAMQKLRAALSEESDFMTPLITRSCQLKTLTKQYIGGYLSETEYHLQKNGLTNAISSLLDELSEMDLNLNQSNDKLQDSIQQLLFKNMGRIHLVNCNRSIEHSAFLHFFRDHTNLPYQFFFQTVSENMYKKNRAFCGDGAIGPGRFRSRRFVCC